jgi:RNA polymerase sigma factor (TIGR02999 family)
MSENRGHGLSRFSGRDRPAGVEQARRKGAHKRGGGARRVELTQRLAIIEPPADDLLAVDEAIRRLQAEKPHLAEIAMLRYFAGLSSDETAAVLGISASTLAREWRFARAWLARHLGDASARARCADE